MQMLHIKATDNSPEILLSPQKNSFFIRGKSSPEDVRAIYYPVIEWIKIFIDDILEGEFKNYNAENPLKFQIDLSYFNSSSAKFLYDILLEFKRLTTAGIPIVVEWIFHSLQKRQGANDRAERTLLPPRQSRYKFRISRTSTTGYY
jgi:hypothetical protein